MPASLVEAFAGPSSATNTESLHNPDYRPYQVQHDHGGSYPQHGGGNLDPYPRLQSSTVARSTVTLDEDTKCDLHIYHILSCPECRTRIKKLLADPPSKKPDSGLLDMIGGGNLEHLLTEKLDKLLARRETAGQVGGNFLASGLTVENLLILILLGLLIYYAVDRLMRG